MNQSPFTASKIASKIGDDISNAGVWIWLKEGKMLLMLISTFTSFWLLAVAEDLWRGLYCFLKKVSSYRVWYFRFVRDILLCSGIRRIMISNVKWSVLMSFSSVFLGKLYNYFCFDFFLENYWNPKWNIVDWTEWSRNSYISFHYLLFLLPIAFCVRWRGCIRYLVTTFCIPTSRQWAVPTAQQSL